MFVSIRSSVLMLIISFSCTIFENVQGFTIVRGTHTKTLAPSSTMVLWSILDPNNNNDTGEEDSWEGFNPFEKKKTKTPLNPLIGSNNNISLRQLRMKELMNKLLQNVSLEDDNDNANILGSILDQNRELLLEPLNEDEAVMDEDSIYEPGMSREERFDRYDQVMEQRIEKSMNKSVTRILSVMRDYVSEQR
jgi:hypothetical protein